MPDIKVNDLVGWYFERSNATQVFWNLFITIILALLVFFGSAKEPRPKKVAAALSLAFVMFAIVNLRGLLNVWQQRNTLAIQICKSAKSSSDENAQALADIIRPYANGWVYAVHVTADALTRAGISYFVLKKTSSSNGHGNQRCAALGRRTDSRDRPPMAYNVVRTRGAHCVQIGVRRRVFVVGQRLSHAVA